jgi:nitrite reductase (cytochrome c-552)
MRRSAFAIASTGIILVLAVALIAVLIFMRNQAPTTRGIQQLVEIPTMEPDSSVWGVNFPNQYTTWKLTETNNIRTTYGGADPFDKLAENPRLLILFAGMAFSKEYNEDRGHFNALHDVEEIQRVTESTQATCYSCKTSDNPSLWAQYGKEGYENHLFSEMGEHINNPIGCANCHEADTMRLIVTNPALENALAAQGKDWTTFTRQEMRTVVCANCHVEYYFADGKHLTFPWQNGTRIEDISLYFEQIEFNDWVHADSGAPMIKMQHPEYELYTADSTHFKGGVACADCHMPYTREGAAKFSSHNVRSPLLSPSVACGACHTNLDFVTGRVAIIQDQVWERMEAAEEAIVDAIAAIKAASQVPGHDVELIEEARWLHREAQLRWDFIAAENSMGFHNPQEALRILGDATDLGRQAQLKAVMAAGGSAALQTSNR